MELWIRSQDKETLLKCNIIAIIPNSEDGSYKIVKYFENGHYIILGYYISKTRALEVLNEIETEIQNYVGTAAQIVYEMPEECINANQL